MGSKKKNDEKKKSGAGRILTLAVFVFGGGIGAALWFAPEQVQTQLSALRAMFGL